MSKEEIENNKLIEGSMMEAAPRYLRVYLGEPQNGDWISNINALASRNMNKQDDLPGFMRRAVSCAILIGHDKVDDSGPESVLHKCQYWRQFNERDWFEELKKIAIQDNEVLKSRAELLSLGVVHPLAWQPYTRQAFGWLVRKSEDMGDINPDNEEDVKEKLKNLVYTYGGMAVCSVYEKASSQDNFGSILNMRTGYFFERLIHSYYTHEQLVRIKKKELSKTAPKLVKSIKVNQ